MSHRKVVAALAAVGALGIAAYAAGAGSVSSGAVGICVKPNGQLRAVTPENPCVTPEELQQWTVHGVEAVEAGPGLVGGSLGGIASIRVDPALIEQANAGRIFAGFDDGPYLVNGLSRRLTLPPGAYAITAKLTVTSQPEPETPNLPETKWGSVVTCRLAAGADFDESRAVVSGNRNDDATKTLGLSLAVVHRFDGVGEADLECDSRFNFECAPFACIDDFGPKFEDLKIVAIRATSLSNHFLA